jgi:hypothetical protein
MNGTITNHSRNNATAHVLTSLGYADPMDAARQQARMMLSGRLAHYRNAVQQLEQKQGLAPGEMQRRYEAAGEENSELDDDYVAWQWYTNAIAQVEAQLGIITGQQG